jgi:hypothetical protein
MCYDCSVSFKIIQETTIISCITFHLQKDHAIYHISLYPRENRTEVCSIKKVGDLTNPPVIIKIDSMMNGLTPQNALDKLQTLLVFS